MVWLVTAVSLLLAGHYVKVLRWRLFIELYEKADISVLLKSLSVAHVINFIVPFHLGDIYRIWYSGRRMGNGIKFSFATIVVEHYIDLIVLAILCAVLYALGHNTMGTVVLVATVAATVVLLTVITMKWDDKTKSIIVRFAEIFNSTIELSLLGFIWTFVSIFKKLISSMSKTQVLVSTSVMWLLYLGSYWCFAESLQNMGVNIRLRDVVDIFFNKSSIMNADLYSFSGNRSIMPFYVSIYVLLPLAIIFIASYFYEKKRLTQRINEPSSCSVIPHVNSHDALTFLETFFRGNFGGAYLKGFLEVNKDVSILEDHSAGSNAVTLLCTDGNKTFYRKFAIGSDGEKLYQQVEWLQAHNGIIPLPVLLNVNKNKSYCSYDMEYRESAMNFFTYIHTHSVENSWAILKSALEDLNHRLYQFNETADSPIIEEYVSKKVVKNMQIIRESTLLSDILGYEEVYLNGVKYDNLCKFDKLFDVTHLSRVFVDSPVCDIHGDLTIENIICDKDSYYLIDPNTGNILECPYLDLGKLFQSLHGGYEFLMRVQNVNIKGNHIDFTFMRSSAYEKLFQLLRQYIIDTYGEHVLVQVYYHELVHWLRLMPYKLNSLGERALIFYAGFVMVLNDIMHDERISDTGNA